MKNFWYGVIDRISEGSAVIIIDEQKKEVVIDVQSLPFEANEGDWLTLQVSDKNEIIYVQKNSMITTIHAKNIDNVAQRLRSKSGSKFKK